MDRVEAVFRAKAKEIYPNPEPPTGDDANLTRYERAFQASQQARSEHREVALAGFLRNCPSLSVCTREGLVLRVSPNLVRRENGRVIKTFKGYWFLDRSTWLVSTRKAEDWLASNNDDITRLATLIRVHKGQGMSRKASEALVLREALMAASTTVAPLLEVIAPFVGGAITIAEADVPSDPDRFFHSGRQGNAEFDDTEDDNPQIGRPSKQGAALAAFWKHFPEGHQGSTWKHITSVVSADLGMPVGADTLRRALGLRK